MNGDSVYYWKSGSNISEIMWNSGARKEEEYATLQCSREHSSSLLKDRGENEKHLFICEGNPRLSGRLLLLFGQLIWKLGLIERPGTLNWCQYLEQAD